jgi:hypothetical protein
MPTAGGQASSGEVSFDRATFSGGDVDFGGSQLSGGAEFSGGMVSFRFAEFSGGRVTFSRATFSGGEVDFGRAGSWSVPPEFPWTDTPPQGVKLPQSKINPRYRPT